ncbi:MAG: tetratricopeptide repeat protein, partial [Candidatus Ratteibacteria bacterium]
LPRYSICTNTYKLLIECYDRQAKYKEKHKTIKKYGQFLHPEEKEKQAQIIKEHADKLREEGETTEAIILYRLIGKEYSETSVLVEILLLLGQIMEQEKDYQNAIREYENILNKKNVFLTKESLLNIGKAYKQANKNKEAIEIFQKLLAQFPDSILKEETLYELATTYYNYGDKIKSKEKFNEYLKEYPNGKYNKVVEIFLKFLNIK